MNALATLMLTATIVLIAVTGLVLRRSRTPSVVGATESDGVGA